jgi:hypothetical protein
MEEALQSTQTRSTTPSVVARIGRLLAPVAVGLLVLEVIFAINELWVYTVQHGYSPHNRAVGIALSILFLVIGPGVVAFIWFDLVRTGMSKESRIALIGYVGSAVAVMAILMILVVDAGVRT